MKRKNNKSNNRLASTSSRISRDRSYRDQDEDQDEFSQDEEEVFNLGIDGNETESESENEKEVDGDDDDDYDDNNDNEDEDEDEDEDDYSDELSNEEDVRKIINKLPSEARSFILHGKKRDDDIDDFIDRDDEDEEEDENINSSWGKKKSIYWAGDTADLEIGQDFQDAQDEEIAVQELHKENLKKLTEQDFYEPFHDEDENLTKKRNKASKTSSDALNNDLQALALGKNETNDLRLIKRDLNKLSKDQKLSILASESPELIPLIKELKERVFELKQIILPIKLLLKEFKSDIAEKDELVAYIEVKYQLMLAYCMNVVFYLAMKCEGLSVKSHPVMKQLLELRYAIEKIKPLDGKLKYQIDRLINISNSKSGDQKALLRPNLQAFEESANEEEEDDDINENLYQSKAKSNTSQKYVAPKIAAVPYNLEETSLDKQQKRIERKKNKLKNSAIFESLREEFGTTPEFYSSSGANNSNEARKQLEAEEEERRNFEEDRFVRLTLTRKEKQSIKKRRTESQKLDSITDIGDIGLLEELNNDDFKKTSQKSSNQDKASELLKKALSSFSDQKDFKAQTSTRRKAPDYSMENIEGDEFEGLVEDFSARKKGFNTEKQHHYAAEPRYGGLDSEEISEGKKRAASYEIIKNRGLTPHRKKSNRNPRVKKREMYAKAVVARKGQVREVISGAAGQYGGETTGIKANIARSRKINN